MTNINDTLKELFSDLRSNQKKILNERFGLLGKKKTLQSIGDDLGVTRERIRQIESQTIQEIKNDLRNKFSDFIKKSEDILGDLGGVCKKDEFINKIKKVNDFKNSNNIDNKIKFIFIIAQKPLFSKEDRKVYSFWYKTEQTKKNLFNYLKKVIQYFKTEYRDKIIKGKIYKNKFNDSYFDNFILISKEFGTNMFGDLGLRVWPEIEPKVIRDKAFLVLKKGEKPLHFGEIANQISDVNTNKTKAHVQTVHNELIKDNRFILVGRGIYSLKGLGYEGGTVKEVIQRILDNKGPLASHEVVKLVNQRKILKENTILLNLQNKSYFKKLDDGRYHIKEA